MADHQNVRSTVIMKSIKPPSFDKLLTYLELPRASDYREQYKDCLSYLNLLPGVFQVCLLNRVIQEGPGTKQGIGG